MDNIWKVAGNINLMIAFFCNSNNPRITKSIPVSETKNKSYFLLLLNPWWNMKAMVNIPFSWNPLWNHLAPHKFHWSSNHKWDGKHLVQHETQIANVESKYLWLINDELLDNKNYYSHFTNLHRHNNPLEQVLKEVVYFSTVEMKEGHSHNYQHEC